MVGWAKIKGEWEAVAEGDTLENTHERLLLVASDLKTKNRLITNGQHPLTVLRTEEHANSQNCP